jgi:hypothetical protein
MAKRRDHPHMHVKIGAPAQQPITSKRTPMPLAQLAVDEGPHNSDGLLLHGWDETAQVTAFISRRVMDDWADPRQPYGRRKSLFRKQYNALGTHNLPAIARIVTAKYDWGAAFNRQHPFVDVLLSDVTDSGEALDVSNLVPEERHEPAQLRP